MKVLSGVACAVIIGAAALTGKTLVLILGVAVIGLAWAWSPRGYEVSREEIVVRRLIGPARIPLTDLRTARPAGGDDLSGTIRLFGNGGLFGYYGVFSTAKLGRCTWYCTRRDPMIVVIAGSKTALFSPDDPTAFLAALVDVPSGGPAGAPIAARPSKRIASTSARLGATIGAAIGAAALALVAAAFLYSPGPPS